MLKAFLYYRVESGKWKVKEEILRISFYFIIKRRRRFFLNCPLSTVHCGGSKPPPYDWWIRKTVHCPLSTFHFPV